MYNFFTPLLQKWKEDKICAILKVMQQLIAHLIGDYILQTHWMAVNKVNKLWIAFIHGFFYTLPFLFITLNPFSLFVIFFTHALIDRYRIAMYITRLKNWCFQGNGYPEGTPIWLSTWLVIILDNTLHLFINFLVL